MQKIIIALSVVFMLAACDGAAPEDTAGLDPAIRERALDIYNNGKGSGTPCLACHSLDGTALVGPTFEGIATRAATRKEGTSAEAYLREAILNPAAYVVDGYSNAMPATYPDALTEEDVDALVEWMLTFD